MVKHNNQVPNGHFHKDWARHVKTWFDQPARKKRRRQARLTKAKRIAPRPVGGALRPVVHAPTNRYNRKIRLGRGFTLEELKEAGINRHIAPGIGISIDHRRRNKSINSMQENAQRLKSYKSRLIIFPRNKKVSKKGDSTKEELTQAKQQTTKIVDPLRLKDRKQKARPITEDEKKVNVYEKLRQARATARLIGIRKKRAAEKVASGVDDEKEKKKKREKIKEKEKKQGKKNQKNPKNQKNQRNPKNPKNPKNQKNQRNQKKLLSKRSKLRYMTNHNKH